MRCKSRFLVMTVAFSVVSRAKRFLQCRSFVRRRQHNARVSERPLSGGVGGTLESDALAEDQDRMKRGLGLNNMTIEDAQRKLRAPRTVVTIFTPP